MIIRIRNCIISSFLCFAIIFSNAGTTYASSGYFSFILLSDYSQIMDIGDSFYLIAVPSTCKRVSFKSSNSSVASVNTYGRITAKKSGSATITAKISGAEASCRVTVKKTVITISRTTASLENGDTLRLTARTSNGSSIKWKVNKKSIATISENGTVTAHKPGVATITATADKTTVTCRITVRKPTIRLNKTRITLNPGQSFKFSAIVSSGIVPTWKSSRKSIAIIDDNGWLYAIKSGTTIITAKVDGVSKTCIVTVR